MYTAFERRAYLKGNKHTVAKSIQVFMHADTIQKRTANGLQFYVRWQNSSRKAVVLKNQPEPLIVDLYDTAWESVQVPRYGWLPGINGKWINKSFVVTRVAINGQEADVKDFVQNDAITIPGKGTVEVFMAITNVLKPGAVVPYTDEQTMPLPGGQYSLMLTAILTQEASVVIIRTPPVHICYQ